LDLNVGHRAQQVREWFGELPKWLQKLFALGRTTTITGRQAKNWGALQSSTCGLANQFVGTLSAEFTPLTQDFSCLGSFALLLPERPKLCANPDGRRAAQGDSAFSELGSGRTRLLLLACSWASSDSASVPDMKETGLT
jgi:hypothetical protein